MKIGSVKYVLGCFDALNGNAGYFCPENTLMAVQPVYFVNAEAAPLVETLINEGLSVVANEVKPANNLVNAVDLDYSVASAFFALAFASVVGLFLVSRSSGAILNFIRGRMI